MRRNRTTVRKTLKHGDCGPKHLRDKEVAEEKRKQDQNTEGSEKTMSSKLETNSQPTNQRVFRC